MKVKILLTGLAAFSLVGCSQEEVVLSNDTITSEISFSAHVDKASRAQETTLSNLTKFKVWTTKKRVGQVNAPLVHILDGALVTKQANGKWTYSPTKYWVNDNAYSFTAIGSRSGNASNYYTYTLPDELADGPFMNNFHGSINYDCGSAAGAEDLVWASKKVAKVQEGNLPGEVKFSFKHLLSKVDLKFINVRTYDEWIEISNVSVESAAKGTLDFGNYGVNANSNDFKWVPNTAMKFDCAFNFGDNSSTIINKDDEDVTEAKFLIPTQDEITVSFDVMSQTMQSESDGTINITKQVKFNSTLTSEAFEGITLKPGYSYTLVAYIDDTLESNGPIVLSVVEVEEFKDIINGQYLLAAQLGEEQTFSYYSDTKVADMEQKTLTVNSVQINPKAELVYYGQNASLSYVSENYKYVWSLPSNNGVVAFDDDTFTKVFDYGEVHGTAEMSAPIKFIGDCAYEYNSVTVTFTAYDHDGDVAVKVAQQIKFVQKEYGSTTGGSQDGDDNDG